MVSAELLEQLNGCVSQAVSSVGTYKLRPDKSVRPFAGVNLVMVADFWQLPPVGEIALFARPSAAPSGTATAGLALMWDRSRDSIQRVWELTDPMRCDDPWLLAFAGVPQRASLGAELFLHARCPDG